MGPSRRLYTEVNKLIRLLLTILASSATAEQIFSSLHRSKTYTRSTMNAARLNNVKLPYVYTRIARTVNKTSTLYAHLWLQLTRGRTHLETITPSLHSNAPLIIVALAYCVVYSEVYKSWQLEFDV